jgi:hypothetical protein
MSQAAAIPVDRTETDKLYKFALYLSIFTIMYNIAEGLISTWIGYSDESLTLFGFGVDSFIETISGIGIAAMVMRIARNPLSSKSQFEVTALKDHRLVILWTLRRFAGFCCSLHCFPVDSRNRPSGE